MLCFRLLSHLLYVNMTVPLYNCVLLHLHCNLYCSYVTILKDRGHFYHSYFFNCKTLLIRSMNNREILEMHLYHLIICKSLSLFAINATQNVFRKNPLAGYSRDHFIYVMFVVILWCVWKFRPLNLLVWNVECKLLLDCVIMMNSGWIMKDSLSDT